MRDRTTKWIVPAIVVVGLVTLIGLGYAQHRSDKTTVVAGSKAPDFQAPTPAGAELGLGALRGKVVLLNIFATWCPPCRFEMPSLEKIYQRFHGEGLEILSVAEDDAPGTGGPDGEVARYMKQHGLTFPVVLDPTGRVQNLYGVTGLPTTFVINKRGRVVARLLGGREWDAGNTPEQIQKLIGE